MLLFSLLITLPYYIRNTISYFIKKIFIYLTIE